jgi:hypothetical protein
VGNYSSTNPTSFTGNLSWDLIGEISWDETAKNVIKAQKSIAIDGNKSTPSYCFQKNFKKWKVLPWMAILPCTATSVAIGGNKSKKALRKGRSSNALQGGDFPKEKYKEKNIYSCEFFSVTVKQHRIFQQAFPRLDLLSEYKKMTAYLESNPRKRKTRTGYLRFIYNWLSKASQENTKREKNWFEELPE